MKFTKHLLVTAAATPLLLTTPTWAQTAPPASAPDPQQETASQLDEIVVTAQKRSESINSVGMTIQALSGEQLAQQGVSTVADLVRVIPALTVANSSYNTPVYTLRGVGFYDNSLAAYPAVSVYSDELPLPFPVMTAQAGLDLERVEVLKGPQGTLFGENATGGAINYIAAKPTADFQAGLNASYSRFGLIESSAFVSGPLSDTIRARLAVKGAQGGAWQRSNTRNDELGDADSFAARLLVDWDASERLRFSLNLNGFSDQSDPQASQYFQLNPQLPVIPAALASAQFSPQNPRAADWNPNRRPKGDDTQYQAALRGTYDLTDDITLTSLTSYIDFSRNQVNDPDGIAAESLEFVFTGGIRAFSQELRLANSGANGLQWIVGANYGSNKSDEFAQQYAGVSTVVGTLGFPGHTNDIRLNTETKSYAVFGNIEYELSDALTLKAGVRYTDSKRDAETCTLDPGDSGGYVSAFFAGVSSAVRGTPTPVPPSGGCITLNATTFLPGLYTGELQEDNVSWRLGLDYQLNASTLLYANIAKGYKAGGYLFTNASNSSQFAPVTQESVIDYEAGFKAKLFDRSMQFNGAVFYYAYEDKQVRSKLNDPVFGVLDALVNVPKSHTAGVEFDVHYAPIANLNLNLAGTYVFSRVDEFIGVGFNGGVFDFEGAPLPFAPEIVINAGADYNFPVSENFNAFVGGNAVYTDEQYSVVGTNASSRLKPYTVVDLRLGMETTDGRYRVTVFGKNVFDEYYYTNAPTIYDTQVRYAGRPATYGISFSARY